MNKLTLPTLIALNLMLSLRTTAAIAADEPWECIAQGNSKAWQCTESSTINAAPPSVIPPTNAVIPLEVIEEPMALPSVSTPSAPPVAPTPSAALQTQEHKLTPFTVSTKPAIEASKLTVVQPIAAPIPPPVVEKSPATQEVDEVSKTNYAQINLAALSSEDLAQLIEWIPDESRRCEGYYADSLPYEGEATALQPQQAPLVLSADTSELAQHETIILKGNVVVTQPHQQLNSDITYIYRDPVTGDPLLVDLFGHVEYREPGKLILGDHGSVNLHNKSGSLSHAIYRFTSFELPDNDIAPPPPNTTVTMHELTSWGTAEAINRDANGVLDVEQGTYSTCPPLAKVWWVKANKMRLNQTAGRGSAEGASLWVKDMPVFYAPYFNFPLDDRRQTGFLFPTYGTSTDSGVSVSFPFYWNIAPNYDATITPNYLSKRGVQWNGEFRYLTEESEGMFYGNILFQDEAFADFKADLLAETNPNRPEHSRLANTSDNRSFVSFQDSTRFDAHWSSYIFLNHVSDDYYFEDFNDEPAQITENQVQNVIDLYYQSQHWDFTGRVEAYQTLHPLNQALVENQYQKLPELILDGHYAGVGDLWDLQLNTSAVNFDIQKNPGEDIDQVIGTRVNVNPGISMPLYWLSGFINPKVQFMATQYDLENQPLNLDGTRKDDHISRTLPIASVNAGLFFDRDTTWFGKDYQQTLEPQVFYLYVPYHNQDDIPVFDTDVPPFTFEQLFRTNRFDGIDRVGDANQISFALTTRFLEDKSGIERIRASIGQIIYFEDRRVQIDEINTDLVTRDNTVPPDTPTSPIVGQLVYSIDRNWRAIANAAWDPNVNVANNGNLMFQYRPDDKHVLNFAYNYLRGGDTLAFTPSTSSANDLNQTDISGFWPITTNVSGVARWNYNISHGFTQNAFAGFQYDSCCWAVRLVAGRVFKYQEENIETLSTHPVNDTQFYLEIALKGLGNIGTSSAESLLTKGITGYVEQFGVAG